MPKDDEAGFERDLRTVFIAQVARKADERDLFAFFTECGKVTDVRIIKDTQTRRSKGIAYVEFESMDMCPAAVAKSGQIICGFPCIVQASQAEKNIAAKQEKLAAAQAEQPARVQVSNLHKDIGQDDLQALFSPFGQVVSASIQRDHGPANSGMVTFKALAEAQKAVAHLNGFDLAGMQLVAVLQAPPPPPMMPMGGLTGVLSAGTELLDDHETGGVQVTAQSRAALMQKLARGQDYAGAPSMPAPAPPMHGYPMNAAPPPPPPPMAPVTNMANLPPTQPQPSEYMLLVNMFDPSKETEPNWHIEIQDDVSEECSKFGTVQKCIIDRANPSGLVYREDARPRSRPALLRPLGHSSSRLGQRLRELWLRGCVRVCFYLSTICVHRCAYIYVHIYICVCVGGWACWGVWGGKVWMWMWVCRCCVDGHEGSTLTRVLLPPLVREQSSSTTPTRLSRRPPPSTAVSLLARPSLLFTSPPTSSKSSALSDLEGLASALHLGELSTRHFPPGYLPTPRVGSSAVDSRYPPKL